MLQMPLNLSREHPILFCFSSPSKYLSPPNGMQDLQKTWVSPQWDLEARTETLGGISIAFLAQAMSCPGSWAELGCKHLN